MEARIYAEDAARGFLPSTGRITTFQPPRLPGVRNDVSVEAGSSVSAAYDPMLGKLIVHASGRAECVELMARALDGYLVGGVATNIGFLRWLVEEPAFRSGATSTDFLDRHFRPELLASAAGSGLAALAAAGAAQDLVAPETVKGLDPWRRLGAWRHSFEPRELRFSSLDAAIEVRRDFRRDAWRSRVGNEEAIVRSVGGGVFALEARDANQTFTAWSDAGSVWVSLRGIATRFPRAQPPADAAEAGQRHGGVAVKGAVEAPMSGTIVKVDVKPGEAVKAFQVLVVMEAMKMEHAIVAPYPGTVTTLNARVGQGVTAGDVLAELAEE